MVVAGIDGGGTNTRVVLVSNDGDMVGYGISGPSNYHDVGIKATKENINLALAEAWESAGKRPEELASVFFGMASVVSEKDRMNIRQMAHEIGLAHSSNILVDHDIRIALAGGLAGSPGIDLIVGTGSSCYGRRQDGNDWRCGGWGHILDDYGSAYFLGLQGIIAAIHEADGRGKKTVLTERLMEIIGVSNIQNIMHRLYVQGMSRSEIASLAPIVTQAAEEGDPKAIEILKDGSEQLATYVQVVAEKLDFPQHQTLVTVTGSTVQACPIYKRTLYLALQNRIPCVQIVEPILSPVFGAVLLALEHIGVEPSEPVIQKLLNSSKGVKL